MVGPRTGRRWRPGTLREAVHRATTWAGADGGVAAVEFALVLPVMLTMLLGMSEVTLAVTVDRKVTLLSRSLADLSSRTAAMSSTELANIFGASTLIMQPYDSSALRMVVSSMKVTKVGSVYNGNVDWSCAKGSGATAKDSAATYTVPAGFQTDGSYYMLVETTLPYTPLFGRTITGTINLVTTTPWPVRDGAKVTYSGSCPT